MFIAEETVSVTALDVGLDGSSKLLFRCAPSIFIVVLLVNEIFGFTEAFGVGAPHSLIFFELSISGELGKSGEDDFSEEFRNLNFRILRCRNNCRRGKLEI